MAKRKIIYHGKEYPSIASLARAYHIKVSTLSIFCKRHNYDLTNAMLTNGHAKMQIDKRYSSIELDNKKYPSIRQAAIKLKISYNVIREYIHKYGKKQQQVSFTNFLSNTKNRNKIFFHGLIFDNIQDMADFYGFSPSTMKTHLHKYDFDDPRMIQHFDQHSKSWHE